MTGYLLVRLPLWVLLLPGVELRADDTAVPADVPVALPQGPSAVTVSIALPLRHGKLEAQLGVPVWIEPGRTTTVDLARLVPSVYRLSTNPRSKNSVMRR
jgi:hypothetical protein